MTDRPFNLKEYFPYVRISRKASADGYELNQANSGAVYTQFVDTNTSAAWFLRSQLDIGGWTKRELTAFFATQYLQRPSPYSVTGAIDPTQGGMSIEDVVYISDVPLNLDDAEWFFAGFPRADSDWMTIKFAEGSQRVQTTTNPVSMTMNDSWSFGSGEPTASGMLYCYRLIACRKLVPTPQDIVDFPTIRWVGTGIATGEPEFVYLSRLRRSFELQQLT